MIDEFTLEDLGEAWMQARESVQHARQSDWLTPEDWSVLRSKLEALFSFPNPFLDEDKGVIRIESTAPNMTETGFSRAAAVECKRKMTVLSSRRRQLQMDYLKSTQPELRERMQSNLRQLDSQLEQLRKRMSLMQASEY